MAKSRQLEVTLEEVKAIQRMDTLGASEIESLRKIIGGKQPIAIAPTTKIIIRHSLTQLIPDMVSAFERMLHNGADTDPNCKAKWALANTLYQLEKPNADLFLSGIRHSQPEPVWGKTIDTAPPLRSLCALGLVQSNYSKVLEELADLLADPEHAARAGAARAIGYSQNPAGIPLLRFKVRTGDSELQVMSECFIALLKLSGEQAPMVLQALESGSAATQELAALALGEARIPAAFPAIKRQWQRTREADLRGSFLLAIATIRTEDSIAFLLHQLEHGNLPDAKDALIALDIYRNTTDIWQQIIRTVDFRENSELIAMLRRSQKQN